MLYLRHWVNLGKYSHQFQDHNLRTSKNISVFKEKLLNFIRPSPNSFFDIHNAKGIKLITRLRPGLSYLREHKFKDSFQDTKNPLCNCDQNIESATHFFLHCPFFINERRPLLSTIRSLDSKLLDYIDYDLTQTLLFGNTSQTSSNNFKIINAPLFKIFSFICKSELNQQFSFFTYSQVLSRILVSGDWVIFFSDFCLYFTRNEAKCKFIYIYIYIYIASWSLDCVDH